MSKPSAQATAVQPTAEQVSIAELEARLAVLKGAVAVESFAAPLEAAKRDGFSASIVAAANGASPALRVDY